MVKKTMLLISVAILAALGVYWFVFKDGVEETDNTKASFNQPLHVIENAKKTRFKNFTAQEFSDLYNSFAYPNTKPIINDYSVTGNEQADLALYKLAESVGYRIRSAPVSNNFVDIGNKQTLQRIAAESWKNLKKAAESDSIKLRVTEGYRSAEDQNEIFTGRLGNIDPTAVINGSANQEILQILKTTAPPGYSRHHSGYTIDLACDSDPAVLFKNSECFRWISTDNYINIKKFGWIPSYPEGIENQGPEPESWEYVWVGINALKE